MSSKTVFDHLTEQIDQVVKGRRYIIQEIGNLKVSVDNLKDQVDKSSGGGGNSIGATVNDLKAFMQKTITTLGEMKNTVTQLGGIVKGLAQSVQTLQQSGVRTAAPAPMAAPVYAAPTPAYAAPAPAPVYSAPVAAPMSATAAPAPAGMSAGAAAFDRFNQAIDAKTPAKDLGAMLDALRTALSKANPLNPILFELSMEAGRLKSLGGSPLDDNNVASLKGKVEKWKSKS